MKIKVSSFDIMALLREIRPLIISSVIDNIYQINFNILLLKLHKGERLQAWLLIESGKRFNLTSYTFDKPRTPSQFCRSLRKYIRRGIIEDIHQHEFDRIVVISIKSRLGRFHLICEFFREGNIVLVDSQYKILHALHFRRMRDRNVIRREKLVFPPSSGLNPLSISLRDLKSEMKSYAETPVVKALTKILSIGGLYAEEVTELTEINKRSPCEELSDEEIAKIYDAIKQILEQSEKRAEPQIVLDEDGKYVDVAPFSLKKYSDLKGISFNSFNEAIDRYYAERFVSEISEKNKVQIEKALSKYNSILKKQKEDLKWLNEVREKSQAIGNLIYQHLHELTLLKRSVRAYKDKGLSWEEISSVLLSERELKKEPYTFFRSIIPEKGILVIEIDGKTIQLDVSDTIYRDAEKYYKEAKKMERKLKGLKKAIIEMESRIKSLKIKEEEERAKVQGLRPIRKRRWYEKFRWFLSSDGLLVLGGRDASTNEILIKKKMEPHDVVLHADVSGAPFVLVKTEGKTPPPNTLKEAAIFSASYSKAWRENIEAIDVYWVEPSQVSWSPPSGQYLRKGSFIIRGPKNYLRDMPLKIAIGFLIEKEEIQVIGGPREAVVKRTEYHVEIKPGRVKSGPLAKRIKEILIKTADPEVKGKFKRVRIEDIQQFLPPGGGEIVRRQTIT